MTDGRMLSYWIADAVAKVLVVVTVIAIVLLIHGM